MLASLYAAQGGPGTSSLYVVDFTPGTDYSDSPGVTEIGPIGFALTGLAFDRTTGIMYGVTSNQSGANPRSLVRIDLDTGAGTLIGPETADAPWTDITFNASGQMFACAQQLRLYRVNKATGVGTLVADIGGWYIPGLHDAPVGGGLAYDLTHDKLWLGNGVDGWLTQLDPATAVASPPPFGFLGFRIPAMDFLPGTDIVYVVNPNFWQLRRISVSGSLPTQLVGDLFPNADALAWGPYIRPPAPPDYPVFLGRFRAGG